MGGLLNLTGAEVSRLVRLVQSVVESRADSNI